MTYYHRKLTMEENAGKAKELLQKIIQGKLNKRLQDLSVLGSFHVVEAHSPKIEKFLIDMSKKYNATLNIQNFYNWKVDKDTQV